MLAKLAGGLTLNVVLLQCQETNTVYFSPCLDFLCGWMEFHHFLSLFFLKAISMQIIGFIPWPQKHRWWYGKIGMVELTAEAFNHWELRAKKWHIFSHMEICLRCTEVPLSWKTTLQHISHNAVKTNLPAKKKNTKSDSSSCGMSLYPNLDVYAAGYCLILCIGMWRCELLSQEWPRVSVTAWLMWLHTLRVVDPCASHI